MIDTFPNFVNLRYRSLPHAEFIRLHNQSEENINYETELVH